MSPWIITKADGPHGEWGQDEHLILEQIKRDMSGVPENMFFAVQDKEGMHHEGLPDAERWVMTAQGVHAIPFLRTQRRLRGSAQP